MTKTAVKPPEQSKIMTVDEVAELLQVSKSTAYHTMQRLNQELKDKGFIVHAGRVSRTYLMERCGL
jgi:predicted transcriptional regulator